MGTQYTFKCNKCNYCVESSGKLDYGMQYVVSPYICNDCNIITDVIVGMQGQSYPKESFDNPKKYGLPEFIVKMKNQFYTFEKCDGEHLTDWDSNLGACPKCDGKMLKDNKAAPLLWD